MLCNSLVHILHSTQLLCRHFGWIQARQGKKANTHSVSLHSWESRGSGESTSTLQFRTTKKEVLLWEKKFIVSVHLCIFVFQCLCFGENIPVGQGHLCLRACQVCRCYPVSQPQQMLLFGILAVKKNSVTHICGVFKTCKQKPERQMYTYILSRFARGSRGATSTNGALGKENQNIFRSWR